MIVFPFTQDAVRVSFVNFWPSLDMNDNWFLPPIKSYLVTCGKSFRSVKYFRIDIQFFSVFGSVDKLIKSTAKSKVFFTGENVSEISICNEHKQYKGNCVDYTDLSIGFDYQTNKNYIRLPLWFLHFFTSLDTKDTIRKKLAEFSVTYKKTKFCALIASHDFLKNIRTDIFNLMSKVSSVDCPGKLLHNDDILHFQFNDNKLLYLRDYCFNICPENSNSPGYVTEKLFEALYSGCIPIYHGGGGKDPESGIVNPDCFLWFEPGADNSALLAEVQKLYTNREYYDSFKKRPVFLDTAVDRIHYMLQQYTTRITEIAENCCRSRPQKRS
jgi:hypothetical protein